MKKIFLLAFMTFSAHGAHYPEITQAEVKINYPCGTESSLSKNKEEKETITFFEKGNGELYKQGYILRRRTGLSGSDFTIKYRSDAPFAVNKNHYQELLASGAGELKCEFDFSYHKESPGLSHSCSFKSDSVKPLEEHSQMIAMIGKEMSGGLVIESMKEMMIQSTSWKVKLSSEQEGQNPFIKKPSIEKWTAGNECRLEVSGKLSNFSPEMVKKGFDFLLKLVSKDPSLDQGSKTSWALSVKH